MLMRARQKKRRRKEVESLEEKPNDVVTDLGRNVTNFKLGGGFKYFSFSPLFGEDSHFDDHIFQRGWFNHQVVYYNPHIAVWYYPHNYIT